MISASRSEGCTTARGRCGDDGGVTIVFRVPASAVEPVGLSYSPSMEAVLSLHVLVEPKHHPVQHGWVRAMRKLSPALKREIEAFSFAVRSYFPEFLFPLPTGQLTGFEDELAGLRGADPELVRVEFAVPLLKPWPGGGEDKDPHVLDEPEVRRLLRERVARESDEAMAAMLLDDPRALLERFLTMLERYWREAF